MNIHSYQTIHGYHKIWLWQNFHQEQEVPLNQPLANQLYENFKLHRSSTKKLNQLQKYENYSWK